MALQILKRALTVEELQENPEELVGGIGGEPTVDPTETKDTIVMKGPLAEMYTQALNVAFSKKDSVEDGPAKNESPDAPSLESQAQDQQLLNQLVERMAPAEDTRANTVITVWGAKQTNVTSDDVIDLTTQLAASEDPANDYVLLLDSTQIADGEVKQQENYIDLSVAIESIAASYGVKVYHSLTDYAKTLVKQVAA